MFSDRSSVRISHFSLAATCLAISSSLQQRLRTEEYEWWNFSICRPDFLCLGPALSSLLFRKGRGQISSSNNIRFQIFRKQRKTHLKVCETKHVPENYCETSYRDPLLSPPLSLFSLPSSSIHPYIHSSWENVLKSARSAVLFTPNWAAPPSNVYMYTISIFILNKPRL